MFGHHSQSAGVGKLRKALPVSSARFDDCLCAPAAPALAWRDVLINAHDGAVAVEPDEIERELHREGVHGPGSREEQPVARRERPGTEQPAQSAAEGSGAVDHPALWSLGGRQAPQVRWHRR